MATKKLKLEVDLETTKAKRQLAGMADGAGGSAVDSAAERTAKSLEKAARGAIALGDSTKSASVNVQSAVRAFGGLAIGMAGQYSARYLEQGSTARNAVEYGSGALQGASVGMMAGPWGAAAGAALGLAKTYFDKSGEQKQAMKDFETSERRYSDAKAWKSKFDSMTGKDQLEAELARLKAAETKIAETVRQFTSSGQFDNAAHQKESLSINRSYQSQLEAKIKAIEDKKPTSEQPSIESAVDALSRVGGSFAGGGSGDALLRTNREQVELLRSIERKTGASSWQ